MFRTGRFLRYVVYYYCNYSYFYYFSTTNIAAATMSIVSMRRPALFRGATRGASHSGHLHKILAMVPTIDISGKLLESFFQYHNLKRRRNKQGILQNQPVGTLIGYTVR